MLARSTSAVVLLICLGAVLAGEPYRDERCAAVDQVVDYGTRIGFGQEASKEDWPWHGALYYGERYKCGCTLISEWFVLTAAHCSFNPDTGYSFSVAALRVRLGLFELQHFDGVTAWEYGVSAVRVHPEFVPNGHKHDLALVLLKEKVEFNRFVRVVDVDFGGSPWIEELAGSWGTVVGWGFTEEDSLSNELRMTRMPVVRYTDCVESNPAVFGQLIHKGMFCAGAENGSLVCNGDSGGGMYFFKDDQWQLRGVVSFGTTREGTNLCDLYSYAVFVNVLHYSKWIQQEMDSAGREPARELRTMNFDTTTTTTTTSTTTMSPPTNIRNSPECFQQSAKTITVERNSSISLACNYEPNNSTNSIKWTREIAEYYKTVDLSADLTYRESVQHDILTLGHVEAHHSGRYSCVVEAGDRTFLDNRVVSVTGVIPRFDRESYVAFPIRIREDYFSLKLTFRVEKLSGILFRAESSCGEPVVGVTLREGRVECHFITGRRSAHKISGVEEGIALGLWHTIEIKILYGRGQFLLDNRLQKLFQVDIAAESCGLVQDFVFLGGHEKEVDSGMVGCISSMVLNDEWIDLWKSSTKSRNVTHCLPCVENPCQNGGVCVESVGSEPVLCVCQEGFVGSRCSNRGTSCRSNPCIDGLCKDLDEGFHCVCPSTKHGRLCEQHNTLSGNALRFDTYGYALYSVYTTPDLQIRFRLKISKEQHSLVAFLSEDSYNFNNGLSILLTGNRLQLQVYMDMELKPLVLQSTITMTIDNWFSVSIEIFNGLVYFHVDGEFPLSVNTSGSTPSSSYDRKLYLGGLGEHVDSYRFANSINGFNGCIGELTISNVTSNMTSSFINAKGIENCF